MSRQSFDHQETEFSVAEGETARAKEELRLLESGTRPERIAAQRAVLALAALLFVLAALSLGMAIGSLSSTQQEASMLMILAIFPAVLLSGFLSPVDSMPRSLQWLAAINPIRHFLDIVRGIFLKGTGVVELWPQYTILAATLVLALAFATRRFRQSIA